MMLRCPECRTRRMTHTGVVEHIKKANHALCDCGGYHYKHRPVSRFCHANQWAAYYEAAKRGESEEVLIDISNYIAKEQDEKRT